MITRSLKWLSAALVVGACLVTPLSAQMGPGGGGPGGGGPGGGGPGGFQFDPAQIRQMIMDRYKQQLEVNDEDWAVLEPKVIKILLLQADAANTTGMMRMMMSGFARGGAGGPGMAGGMRGFNMRGNGLAMIFGLDQKPSQVENASEALQDVIDNKEATPDQIKVALNELRDARGKARNDLTTARRELTELLTQRQEARAVQMGLLE